MANYKKICEQCYVPFEAQRSDARFCSGKCVAQYYRDNDNPPLTHAAKPHEFTFHCEECGNAFDVNAYAFRSGKRRPKFCTVKCKQKAYRGRVKEQAARRNAGTDDSKQRQQKKTHSDNSQGYRQQQQKQRQAPPKAAPKKTDWEWLGVSPSATKTQVKSAWRKLVQELHPDRPENNTPENLERLKYVNAAYDRLMKYFG